MRNSSQTSLPSKLNLTKLSGIFLFVCFFFVSSQRSSECLLAVMLTLLFPSDWTREGAEAGIGASADSSVSQLCFQLISAANAANAVLHSMFTSNSISAAMRIRDELFHRSSILVNLPLSLKVSVCPVPAE